MSNDSATELLLDQLADLCCEAIKTDAPLVHDEVQTLVRALANHDWRNQQAQNKSLATVLEMRVADRCDSIAHRRTAVGAVAYEIQQAYDMVFRDLQSSDP